MITKLAILFIIIVFISFSTVIIIRRWLLRSHIVDIPNERSSHSVPTPRGGGLSIVLIVMSVILIYSVKSHQWQQSLVIISMGGLIAWLGWRDDVHSLSPKLRLLVQTIAAFATILGLGYFRSLTIPFIGEFYIGWVGIPLTVLWIVGLTNAYNFMDGLDGFAAGVAVAAGFGWMLLSFLPGEFQNELSFWMAFSITAGSAGFLIHNWPPAKIFMGDVASTFLGYSFAVIPLLVLPEAAGDAAMAGVVIMWTFILDAGITFARRVINREHVFEAHRTHLYQRLAKASSRSFRVNLLFIGLTLFGVLLLLGWLRNIQWIPSVILFGLPGIWLLLSWINKRKENEK